jgi:O-antigen/teichoic acid export membrane protein
MYAGTFILMLVGQAAAAGLFGLSLTLSMGFIVVYQAFGEYLYPRISHVESLGALKRFLRNSLAATLAVIIACVPVVFTVGILVPQFLRAELHAVVPVFYLVAASFVLLIFECPLKPACHYLLRPQFLFTGTALRVALMAGLGFILAPRAGAMGMAYAQLAGTAASLIILALLVAMRLRFERGGGREPVVHSETEIR